ncbi:Endo-1-3(4)-beta-glucanase [Penicillium sp. IBT 35674x]|nr:Endo-1-3(4)-beta-glucanase [Penicillium sp. IBT 35674x]
MLECTLFIILMLLARAAGADYRLAQNFSPFLEQFDFDTGSDPTNGYVDYVDKRTAIELGLVKLVNGTFHIGVEHKDAALPPGRKSVRLTSKKAYSTGTLVVVDLSHMPGVACGSWPAFWTVGENWPLDGEIDIIEGANRALYNQMTLHTGKNCTIDSTGFSGNLLTSNCDVDAAGQSGNAGCGIEAGSATSFGSHFNSIGGGIYAMEWTSNGIGVWFFPRYQIPTGFMSRPSHDPDGWGEPVARFQGDCQIAQHFHKQKIIFDITFCGDLATATWSDSGCQSFSEECESYVAGNPDSFSEEYWGVVSLNVYSTQRSTASTSLTPSSAATCIAHQRRGDAE